MLANETSTFFRVKYPNEILTWVFSVDDQNRIVNATVRDVYY
ncbi:MAG TPA: hypothetical protein VKB39_03025 [Candidatus Baltobacteraceae bacterium]|nr:hypothetical protein [Candidatus Baltobacteraceae bacterium]